MIKQLNKNEARLARHQRVRKHLSGTPSKPRLNVYKSTNHIYAQIIDDVNGVTLVSASTLDKETMALVKDLNKKEQAKIVGEQIAKRAIAKEIKEVVFDRGGYLYTGRVKELADGARSAGLEF